MNRFTQDVRMLHFQQVPTAAPFTLDIESGIDIPFLVKRIFYICAGSHDAVRGRHANKKSRFVLFAVSGSCKISVIDETGRSQVYQLDDPNMALYMPEMVWKEMFSFSSDCVLMVLTNEYYDPEEYINDFGQYQLAIQQSES